MTTYDEMDRAAMIALGERINALEFDTVFDLTPEGEIVVERRDLYAPEVFHDEDPQGDVMGYGPDWTPLVGMTNQEGYRGAVMHPSEFIGRGIADLLMYQAQDETQTYAITTVESFDEDDDTVGWAILHYTPKEKA